MNLSASVWFLTRTKGVFMLSPIIGLAVTISQTLKNGFPNKITKKPEISKSGQIMPTFLKVGYKKI